MFLSLNYNFRFFQNKRGKALDFHLDLPMSSKR